MSSVAETPAVNDERVLRDAMEPGINADQRLLDRGWLKIGAGCLIAGEAMVFSFAMNLSEVDGPAYW